MSRRADIAAILRCAAWGLGAAALHMAAGGRPWTAASLLLAASGAASIERGGIARAACLLLVSAGASLPQAAGWLTAAAAFLGIASGTGFITRALLALSIPPAFQGSASTAVAVASSAAVLSAFSGSRQARTLAILAGVALAMLVEGPPRPGSEAEIVIQETMNGPGISWERFHLDGSRPVALLRTPGMEGGTVDLVLEAGGVRDSMPVGLVFASEGVFSIPPGRSVFDLPLDGGIVEIRMARRYRPFEHPVIHVLEAHARADS